MSSQPAARNRRAAPPPSEGWLDSPAAGVLLGMLIALIVFIAGAALTRPWWDKRSSPPAAAAPLPQPPAGSGLSPAAPTATALLSATPAPTQKPSANPTQKPSAVPTARVTVPPNSYTIQPGDTLFGIAARFNVKPLDLMRANHIASADLIQPGQVLVIPGLGAAVPTLQPGPKSILVKISQQRLYAYQGSQLVYSFTVSTGVQDGTLRGYFQVLDKLPYPHSDPWNFWMPNWMGIYYAGGLENGIHGLPVQDDGSTLWGDSLGTPASYGCVVLGSWEAQLLYDWAEVGTPVVIQD